jgi:hypothetical protein
MLIYFPLILNVHECELTWFEKIKNLFLVKLKKKDLEVDDVTEVNKKGQTQHDKIIDDLYNKNKSDPENDKKL